MAISITALFSTETAEQILERGLAVARIIGLPTDTWRAGDPTRSLYKYLAEVLETLEGTNAEFVRAGFLSTARTDWLTVLALEVYGVTRVEATFAAVADGVTLTNSGGALYEVLANELTFKSSTSQKTYHNTSAGTLSAGATVSFDIVADEAGSDSSAGVNEIDELVTTLLGVAVDSSLALVGIDEQTDAALRTQCNATLGALSPDGPPDAYEFVVRDTTKTGVDDITRAASTEDGTTGVVTVFVAGASGAVAGASVTAAQAAIDTFATPLTVTATVVNATAVPTVVDVTVTGTDIPGDAQSSIETRLTAFFGSIDIGGLVSVSKITQEIHAAVPEIDTLTLTLPAADASLSAGEVATLTLPITYVET
jgi:phage-related baseplate assembly protein